MKNPFKFYEPQENQSFILQQAENKNSTEPEAFKISKNLKTNEEYIKKRFRIPENNDVIYRSFELKGGKKAFAVFIEGMVNSAFVSSNITFSSGRYYLHKTR